jgi:bifunctional DNase/RNase
MIAELADSQSIFLTEVEVYERGDVLRADLYFSGRGGNLVLRNYRASDSIALATYYDVPIKMKKKLFDKLASQI